MLERILGAIDWWRLPADQRKMHREAYTKPSLWLCVHAGTPNYFYLADTYRGEAIRYLEKSQGYTVVHIDDENRVILFRKVQM